MKTMLKGRWGIVLFWLLATAVLTWFTPNLDPIINQRGNLSFADKYPSQTAQEMIDEISTASGDSGIFVFYDKDTLTTQDFDDIQATLEKLKTNKETLGITGLVDVYDYPEAKEKLVSKDNTTMIVQFTYEKGSRDTQVIVTELEKSLEDLQVEHYITGGAFITNDFLKQTNAGVEKSAVITVLFIFIVLVVMFRSPVTPLISLITVGITYLTSMGIVGQLIDKFGFPVTSLTRMFLILILFGIGTDYNILLFNRFKEELSNHPKNIDKAIATTYKTAGKTVIYSALTIFIAFLALNFVKFSVYRSGVAVAVGIFVLVAQLMTLTPAILRILNTRLFWPSKNVAGHSQSKTWTKAAMFSVKRPAIAIAAIAVLLIPIFMASSYKLSFDNLQDMSNEYPSVMGFNIVAEHFNKGTSMPTTIVLSNASPLDNNTDLAVLDGLTKKIEKIDGVNAVMGPTQPQGYEIADFYSDSQTKKVVIGMTSANNGVREITDGLGTIQEKLTTPDFSEVDQLVDGTSKLQTGLGSLASALKQVSSGIGEGASGAEEIADGIEQIKSNLLIVNGMVNQLHSGYASLESGYETFGKNYKSLQQSLRGLAQLAAGINQIVAANPTYADLLVQVSQMNEGLAELDSGFAALNDQYNLTLDSFSKLNEGLSQLSGGIIRISEGLSRLENGQRSLAEGLKQGNNGGDFIVSNMEEMTEGLAQISGGQQQMAGGLSSLGGSLTQLKSGIVASSDGLGQISEGIDQSNDFLTGFESTKVFYLPEEALQSKDFQKALDAYMSKDRKTVKLLVTLDDDPYSDNAINTIARINQLIPSSLAGTSLADGQYAIGGETSTTNDLHGIAISDMKTTQVIVLIGIFIVLVLIIKSFWIPVYIIASLLLSFYTSISLTSLFAKQFLDSSELAWNVPFFGFVMIVALGVDYSIFLMMRFKEYKGMTPHEGIIKASGNVGGVVLSAAIILAGTFATLAPSGINTLIELAVCVCLGIIILSVILLPFVIPAFISIQDKLVKKYSYEQNDIYPELTNSNSQV
ncbi:MMPL family transporter [Desulfosporosinus hippei]|uniref:Putative drug exporter of the RND superfamily n=1 Tax=Desulfosporosinus hippei DSM 8344 TaxID=1121419 RepID=A0A1G8FFZ9_9FIRM|nr:MMPL family transporter [Desulfosporosinus hippei]SDH81081.1 putative drug exporter of the RND superfamily [Desulfosporosinus hippei DSM 8344]